MAISIDMHYLRGVLLILSMVDWITKKKPSLVTGGAF